MASVKGQLKTFALALLSFIVLDFLWLGFVVKGFNLAQLAEIGRIENGDFSILYLPAAGAYLLMALAIAAFVAPLTRGRSRPQALLAGAAMGLIIYGIFDLTNLAILKNYPVLFAAADVAWGTVVFGIVALITHERSPS